LKFDKSKESGIRKQDSGIRSQESGRRKGKVVTGYSLLDGNLKIDRCALGASRQSVT
jgi:hypothetical protein